MIARDAAIAGYEGGAHPHPAPERAASRSRRSPPPRRAACGSPPRPAPHHLSLTDEAVRERLDTRMKMNPPLRAEADRQALIEGLRDGTIDCVATDHAPHARDEKEVPFEQAPMGTTGLETAFAALYTELVLPGVLPLDARRRQADAGAALLDLPLPAIAHGRAGEPRLSTSRPSGRWARPATRAARRTAASPAARCAAASCSTVAAGAVAYRERAFSAGGRRVSLLERERAALVVIDVQEAFRPAVDELRRGRRAARGAARPGRARSSGCRSSSPSSTRRASATTAPELASPRRRGAPSRRPSSRAARADGFDLGGPRPGARLRDRGARLRQPDGRSTCSTRGVEVHVAADAVSLAHRAQPRGRAWRRWSAPARSRRASRWRCSSCSARPARPSSRRSRRLIK